VGAAFQPRSRGFCDLIEHMRNAKWAMPNGNWPDDCRDIARMFHELQSRDRGDGCATGQPQGFGPEAYLNGTSQGSTPEDAREDGHIRGRSRRFMKYPGLDQGLMDFVDILMIPFMYSL